MRSATVIVLVLALAATSAFAAGGKHHGDKGKGNVIQNQVKK